MEGALFKKFFCRVIYPGVRYLEYGKCQFMSDTGLPVDDLNTEPYTSYRLCDIPGGFRYLSDKKMIEKFLFSDPEVRLSSFFFHRLSVSWSNIC